jgi:hypothetical protein
MGAGDEVGYAANLSEVMVGNLAAWSTSHGALAEAGVTTPLETGTGVD